MEDDLLEEARNLARRRGVSLQELLREHLRTLVGERSGSEVAGELLELMKTHGGRSGGRRWRREDAYEGREDLQHGQVVDGVRIQNPFL